MPIIPVGYAQVLGRISLTGDAQEMAITFGVEGAVLSQANADDISAALATFVKGSIGSNYTYQGAIVSGGGIGGGLVWETTEGTGVGLNSSSTLPSNCAYLYRKRTALGGRKNRGRMFLPGVGEADVNSLGVISTGVVGALQALADDLLTDLDAAGYPMHILHNDSTPPTQVTALLLDSVIATQRRRLR